MYTPSQSVPSFRLYVRLIRAIEVCASLEVVSDYFGNRDEEYAHEIKKYLIHGLAKSSVRVKIRFYSSQMYVLRRSLIVYSKHQKLNILQHFLPILKDPLAKIPKSGVSDLKTRPI